MFEWQNPYSPSTEAGQAGTMKVPSFILSDWRLVKNDATGVRYVHLGEDPGYAELDLNSTTVNNLYGNSSVAGNEQLTLLKGRSVYARLRLFGLAVDPQGPNGLAPISVSMNITVPTGVVLLENDLQEIVETLLSAFSTPTRSADEEVKPLSDVMEMSRGALLKS
jgi:hypothetical protein